MIRSYGLHWRKEDVFWGWQNKQGTLLGRASKSKKAREVILRYKEVSTHSMQTTTSYTSAKRAREIRDYLSD